MKKLTYLLFLLVIILSSCEKNKTLPEKPREYTSVMLSLSPSITDVGPLKTADLSQYVPLAFTSFDLILIDDKGTKAFAGYDLLGTDSLLLPVGTFKVQIASHQSDLLAGESAFFDQQELPDSLEITKSTTTVSLEVAPSCSLFYSEENLNLSFRKAATDPDRSLMCGEVSYDPGDGTSSTLYYIYVRCEGIGDYDQYVLYVGDQYISLIGKYENGRKFYANPTTIANLQATFTDSSL